MSRKIVEHATCSHCPLEQLCLIVIFQDIELTKLKKCSEKSYDKWARVTGKARAADGVFVKDMCCL